MQDVWYVICTSLMMRWWKVVKSYIRGVNVVDSALIESIMSFIAIFSLSSWIPQIARMLERKQTDDFSLWTTIILIFCNGSWWFYAIYIESISFFIQQTLTLIMLLCFGSIIIKYRTTPLLFKAKQEVRN
jgi:uncharacterized protein with PQ loop repeat